MRLRLCVLVVLSSVCAPGSAAARCVMRVELDGLIVNAGTAAYLDGALDEAARQRCGALLVVLDTPGGDLEATRRIVQSFLGAPVPVIVYVSPAGARAGSAGMFITMAAHVAAMTPASTVGAAHPVLATGRDPDEAGEELGRKVVSDVSALARAIAVERGRNADWAELAVRESRSATAAEALELEVIDRVAPSESALLAAIDGEEIHVRGRSVSLRTAGVATVAFEMTAKQRLLATLGNPNLAFLLLMIGLLGLLIELSSPGLFVPGIVGGIALLLGAIGLNVLPVHFGAVVLIVAGVGLLAAELYVTSYGLLAASGIAAIAGGAVLLVDPGDLTFFADASVRVSWGVLLPTILALAAALGLLAWRARRVSRMPPSTGAEGLVGGQAKTLSSIDASGGRVSIGGESWAARSRSPIPAGRDVRVREVHGLELEVEAGAEGEVGR
jgi:membrane-bound serine protease (ClpP class)